MMSGIFTEDPRIVWFWLHYLFRCNSHYARTCCILLKKETDGGEKYSTTVYGNVIQENKSDMIKGNSIYANCSHVCPHF